MDIFDLAGADKALSERDVAADMQRDSKFAVISLAAAVTEIDNKELRRLLAKKLNVAVDQHYQLADILMKKDWYKPYLAPQRQVARELQAAGPPANS